MVVVGGGIVGVSTAYHLVAAGAGRVVLLERESGFGAGSTGRCAGGFRHQFSSRVNVELSLASIPLIVGFEATHGLPLDVVQDGYLFLVRGDAAWAGFRAAAEMQRGLGVDVRLLAPEDAAELVPGLDVDDVTGATYCPVDGIADPSGLTLGYATIARRAGADLRTGVEATAIVTTADRLTRVETTDGPIDTETVIDAAGPWAGRLAAMAGVELPLEPIPRVVLVTAPFPGAPARKTLVIDAATSFYFHREAGGVLMGMGDPAERPTFETRVDERFVAEELLPTAVRIVPAAGRRRDRPALGRPVRDDARPPSDPRAGAGAVRAGPRQRLQRARLPARPDRRQVARGARRRRCGQDGGHLVARSRPVRGSPGVHGAARRLTAPAGRPPSVSGRSRSARDRRSGPMWHDQTR